MPLPLKRYEGFRSDDVDETREHELKVLGRGLRLDARFQCLRLSTMALAYVSYGVPVYVSPGVIGSFNVVQGNVTGRGVVRCGREQTVTSARHLAVTNPDEPLSMWLSEDSGVFVVQLDWAAVCRQLAAMTGQDNIRLSFEVGMDLAGGYPLDWFTLLEKLFWLADRGRALTMNPLLCAEIEERVIGGLLLAQRNSCSRVLAQRGRPAPPRLLCQAVDIIEAEPRGAHTPSSLAQRVGVGVLDLEAAFLTCRGVAVRDYVRNVRLKGAHLRLAAGDPATIRPDEVARQWGFVDLQAFDARYVTLFGESPRETLAR
ncbi:AraC family transcriptional regulator [Amycolatopsis thermoflava]|uniref:AraC family transcriptional regulator n=1 Tax=Amycolatopsis thermoflava TaxID=84480 RepID=UPI003658C354